MKMIAITILAASIVALTGCAAAPNPVATVTVVPVIAAPDSTPSVEPRNPVELAKKIDGCQTDEGIPNYFWSFFPYRI